MTDGQFPTPAHPGPPGASARQRDHGQHVVALVADDFVDQEFRRCRQDHPAQSSDHQKHEAEREPPTVRPNHALGFATDCGQRQLLFLGFFFAQGGDHSRSRVAAIIVA